MLARGTTNKANFVALGTVSEETFTPATGIVYDSTDGLYWRKTSGKVENGSELTVTVPDNVRIGGLCKIKGVIYRIKDISGTTVTLDGELENETAAEIYFALAQVIDNDVTESGTTDIYESATSSAPSNDDGDWMVEGITQNGTTYTWNASINSKNIYDGPVTLCFSYFDLAGNVASGTYKGMVSNNAPRLAGVKVACDYNGDGKYSEDNETNTYWVGSANRSLEGKTVKRATGLSSKIIASSDNTATGQAFLTIKDKTQITAEIIGGNGDLFYSYKAGTNLEDPTASGTNAEKFATGTDDYDSYEKADGNGLKYVDSHKANIEITLADF